MKVLLLADVLGGSVLRSSTTKDETEPPRLSAQADVGVRLGWRGDVVEVAAGYARNYLLPQGLAIKESEAPPALAKALAKERAKRADEMEREKKRLQEVAAAVDGAEAVIASTANEQGRLFGSVTSSDIAANLQEQGFEIPADAVRIEAGIKQVGTHAVKIRFAEDVTATVSVVIVPAQHQSGAGPDPASGPPRRTKKGSGPKEKDESSPAEKSG